MSLTNPRLRALQQARRAATIETNTPTHESQPDDDDLKKLHEVEECNIQIPNAPRDSSFWISLIFIVAPLWLVTPGSWAYSIYATHRLLSRPPTSSLSGVLNKWELSLFAFSLLECLFSLYYQSLAAYARRYQSRIPSRDIHELQLIFTRVLQTGLAPPIGPNSRSRPQSPAELITSLPYADPRAEDFRNRFRRWFWGAPWKSITRESMRRWLSWSVFDQRLQSLDPVQRVIIDEATIMIEKRAGGRLREEPEEGQDHIEPILLTWDPVNVWSRPGIVYAIGHALNQATKWYLRTRHDMVFKEYEGIEYLIRNKTGTSPDSPPEHTPLVFLHGIGFGLAQYIFSILLLLHTVPESQPILIPLQPHISNSILHPFHVDPMPREKLVTSMKDLFTELGWDENGVAMISHSKGSVVHTWILKAYPELVKRSCFIDPVCFCLWEGDLCWNFVYRPPSNAVELIMKYFAGTEPGIALTVQRHFDWAANSLWFEEIPRARNPYYTTFFLGGKDAVIDGWRSRRYLLDHGVSEGLHWDPQGRHGQPVLEGKGLDQLKQWLTATEPEGLDFDVNSSDEEAEEVERSVIEA